MSVRFLADADLRHAIVQSVRRRELSIDFKSANEAALQGLIAARDGRVLVSHHKRTMPVHFAIRASSGLRSPGVLLALPSASVGELVEAIVMIWSRPLKRSGPIRSITSPR